MSSEKTCVAQAGSDMDDVVIKAENLSKCYHIYPGNKARLRQIFFPKRKYYEEFWALKNMSFEVRRGEAIGIIGPNGAGKSTLLQVLSGILKPTSGRVEVNGRISALLELGAGFDPQYTGRENAYMNGSIMGMSRREMDGKISKIQDFADIGEFFDRPVRMYSSGMYVRLAFAVAIHLDPTILIIDESLAVGDTSFQFKCIRTMNKLLEKGVTLLFVSHAIPLVQQLCSKVLWIENGSTREFGDTIDVSERYENFYDEKMREQKLELGQVSTMGSFEAGLTDNSKTKIRLKDLKILSDKREERSVFKKGEKMIIRIEYVAEEPFEDAVLGIQIHTDTGFHISHSSNYQQKSVPFALKRGHGVVEGHLESIPLNSGIYHVTYGACSKREFEISMGGHLEKYAKSFKVISERVQHGIVDLPMEWILIDR